MLSRLLKAREIILTDAHDAAARIAQMGHDGTNDILVSDVIRTGELQAWFLAELFRARAITASRLLAGRWTQADLNELGGEFPEGAWWLNPKALDYDVPRDAWQDDLAILHQHARMAALDLRAIATLYLR